MSSIHLSHFQLKTSPQTLLNSPKTLLDFRQFLQSTMNSFVVVFAAVIIAVNGGSLRERRQTGWGAPPTVLEIGLSANAAASGAGTADATQDITAIATGSGAGSGWSSGGSGIPALIDLGAYNAAVVGQDIGITQVASVDLSQPGPTTSTLNLASVDNYAYGDEGISAYLEGTNTYLTSSASDSASGSGAISANANTLNTQSG